MHNADKAVLRLAVGLGLAVLIAYGFAWPMPFLVCVLAMLQLCAPGPPMPLIKGFVVSAIVAVLLMAGVLLVPLLKHYPLSALLLIGAALYAVFYAGARKPNPLTIVQVIALTLIPVAGFAEQALATLLAQACGLGFALGFLVKAISHALFPDTPAPAKAAAAPSGADPQAASRIALQTTVILFPVFLLALTNPALYLAAVLKTTLLAQQADATDARSAGRELVGSTIVGAVMATAVWVGLSLWPNLWMLTLWIVAAAFWGGSRLFQVKPTAYAPSFWLNALVTMWVLLGPGIEDAAIGNDVYQASAIRVSLFIVIALYGWATVWAFERWNASRPLLEARRQ